VILDRSGSMSSMVSEVIKGFNAFVDDQRAIPGKTRWTLMQFDRRGHADDSQFDYVYRDCKGRDVAHLTPHSFVPRGTTPLLDAVGTEVTRLLESDQGAKTVVFIITDGYENASTEYTQAQVKALIAKAEKRGWQVIFMAAGIDAAKEYAFIGGVTGQSITTDPVFYLASNAAASQTVSNYRATGQVTNETKDDTKASV
jgi:hypothetical protein